MNSIPGISFYDALTKLAVGFLLTWWLSCPKEIESILSDTNNEMRTTLYVIFCFVIGTLYCYLFFLIENLLDWLRNEGKWEIIRKSISSFSLKELFSILWEYIPLCKRNYLPFLKKTKGDLVNTSKKQQEIEMEYLSAYYRLQKLGLLGNIPILEGLEAFLRYNFPIMLFYAYRIMCIMHRINNKCCAILITMLVIILWFYGWKKIQCKIHYLVWEANKYTEEINK